MVVHHARQQRAAPDDHRNREGDAEGGHADVPLSGAGDRQDVVDAHRHVGEDDDLDRLAQVVAGAHLCCLAVVVLRARRDGCVRLRRQQLVGNPQQQQPAAGSQQRRRHHPRGDGQKHDAQRDGTKRAPEPTQALLPLRQRSHRHCDHDRVVAGEQQVEQNDAAELQEKAGLFDECEHGGVLVPLQQLLAIQLGAGAPAGSRRAAGCGRGCRRLRGSQSCTRSRNSSFSVSMRTLAPLSRTASF